MLLPAAARFGAKSMFGAVGAAPVSGRGSTLVAE